MFTYLYKNIMFTCLYKNIMFTYMFPLDSYEVPSQML